MLNFEAPDGGSKHTTFDHFEAPGGGPSTRLLDISRLQMGVQAYDFWLWRTSVTLTFRMQNCLLCKEQKWMQQVVSQVPGLPWKFLCGDVERPKPHSIASERTKQQQQTFFCQLLTLNHPFWAEKLCFSKFPVLVNYVENYYLIICFGDLRTKSAI